MDLDFKDGDLMGLKCLSMKAWRSIKGGDRPRFSAPSTPPVQPKELHVF